MKHKWHKEIKAWADGAKIQSRWNDKMSHVKRDWHDCDGLIDWDFPASDFRIKPQPKEDDVNDSLKDFIKSQSDNIKAQQDTIKGYQEIIQMLNARLKKEQPK